MPTPITWNSVDTAVAQLAPLLNASGFLDNVLVRCDRNNACHYQGGPPYRLARFAIDTHGQAVWLWIDADGISGPLELYCVNGWALAQ